MDLNVKEETAGGSPLWAAPEVLLGEKTTTATDMYAFAVILWELLQWREPWLGKSIIAVARMVVAGHRPPVPSELEHAGAQGSTSYVSIMTRAWDADKGKRPSFADVLRDLELVEEQVMADVGMEGADISDARVDGMDDGIYQSVQRAVV